MATLATNNAPAKPFAPRAEWIAGARYDQLFLVAAWLVPVALAAFGTLGPMWLLVPFVLLDVSHQFATFTIFDRTTWKLLGPGTAIGVAAIALLAAGAVRVGGVFALAWTSLFLYWGMFHIVRQHYGFLRLYRSRLSSASADTAKAEEIALYSGMLFPFLLNLSHGWARQDPLVHAWLPHIPPVSAWVVFVVFVLSAGWIVRAAVRRCRARESVGWIRLLHLALVVSNSWLGILVVGKYSLLVAEIFITSYHDFQYHAIVWFVGRARYDGARRDVLEHPAAGLFRARTPVAYVALCIVAALVILALQGHIGGLGRVPSLRVVAPYLFAVFSAFNYMHYFIDGRMWKLRANPQLRRDLRLGAR